MIFWLLAPLILSVSAAFYFLFYRPKQRVEKFALKAQEAGYKVKLEPFTLLDFFVIKYVKQDNRSLQVFKHELKEYDLIVGNLFTNIAILPNNTTILKDLFSQSRKLKKNLIFVEVYKILGEGGISMTEGEEWKRRRRIISSVFHFDFLNDMIPVIESVTDEQFARIDQKIKNKQTINLLASFSKILSSVIVKCFFGTDVNEYQVEGRPYCEFYLDFLNQICEYSQSFQRMIFGMNCYKYGLTKKARTLKKHLNILQSVGRQVIEKQLVKLKNNQFTHKNLLTTLYQNNMLNQSEVQDPNKYTKDELIGEFFSFFGAGTDTTTNSTNLILHYLSERPEYTEKIIQELEEIKSLEGPEKLKNMKWFEAIFNETIRLGGPAASLLPRVVAENVTAGGLQIPAGTSLSIYPIMNQYKPEYFEKPFDFIPERWLKNEPLPPYVYIPFSAGQRNCIGQYLAKIQAKILISKVLQKYKFKAKYPIKMSYGFAYATDHGEFQMEIKDKKQV